MVVLCTVQRDVVHAGYLALALLFFRQVLLCFLKKTMQPSPQPSAHSVHSRQYVLTLLLCRERGRMRRIGTSPSSGQTASAIGSGSGSGSMWGIFWMLPAFNLAVLTLELIYQASPDTSFA